MNTRSLAFRLTTWYAGLVSVVFALVGVAALLGLEQYLENNLENTLARRLTQIREIVLGARGSSREEHLIAAQIEDRLAPEFSNRFVRVLRSDGGELYRSGAPGDHSFDPALIPAPVLRGSTRYETLQRGKRILIVAEPIPTDHGVYLAEIGASLEQIRGVEDHLLTLALLLLPTLVGIAVGGGYFLVRRALVPVENITRHAEQITHHKLSERLPVVRTGDELERLSISLNNMIARLDEAFQNSRRFLADASHELRTPLTIIKGELEQIAVQQRSLCAPGDEENTRIGSVLEEVQRLTIIVEGLFSLSRLDAGEAQREWVRFDLAQLAATTAEQMKLLAEDEGATIICQTPQLVQVEGDRSRLKQVAVNLIDNAIKYAPPGGTIRLSVFDDGKHAILQVSDNGIGIPEQALPFVFDRFFRVDKARSRGGAGLGLAIVKSICTAHGGSIEVDSKLGVGSRFSIRLPLVRTGAGAELALSAALDANHFRQGRPASETNVALPKWGA